MKKIVVSLLFLTWVMYGWSIKQLAPPHAYKKISVNKKYYFKMNPGAGKTGYGAMYQFNMLTQDKLMYETNGWYAHDVDISHDGIYLVRLGYSYYGSFEPDEFALGFYKKGQLIKGYLNKDLVRDKSIFTNKYGQRSGCCLNKVYGFEGKESYYYKVKTLDNMIYVFDVRNGFVRSVKKKS